MEGASANLAADVQQTFKCPYCDQEFMTKRSRGGHLKAHRHLRAAERAAAAGAVVQQPTVSQGHNSAPLPPQQHPNTSRELSVVVSQPRQELLALPAPDPPVITPVQQLENTQDATPIVFFRCCCGVTEKIPQTTQELMERGTNGEGYFTLNHQHQHHPSDEEIRALDFLPLAHEAPVEENPLNVGTDEVEENNIDLTLRI